MGWVWVGLDLCVGLLYEHRFAVLIKDLLILSNDQEARPADKVAGPDPRQSAADVEEGLQLQVFFRQKLFPEHSN